MPSINVPWYPTSYIFAYMYITIIITLLLDLLILRTVSLSYELDRPVFLKIMTFMQLTLGITLNIFLYIKYRNISQPAI